MRLALSFIIVTALTLRIGDGQIVTHHGCTVDAEVLLLPPCALELRRGHLFVLKPYLKLFFTHTRSRLETAMVPNHGWAYFNRSGRVVVDDVAMFDNGASPFHHGLVRVSRDGRWGLANRNGGLVVPLEYDGMYEFDDSHPGWRVCKGCHTVRFGEYFDFEGGKWAWLDRRGRVIGTGDDMRSTETSGLPPS